MLNTRFDELQYDRVWLHSAIFGNQLETLWSSCAHVMYKYIMTTGVVLHSLRPLANSLTYSLRVLGRYQKAPRACPAPILISYDTPKWLRIVAMRLVEVVTIDIIQLSITTEM